MYNNRNDDGFARSETTCGLMLFELQKLWDEVGETEEDRDRMLLEIEQECLEVYKNKVREADGFRTKLRHQIETSEAEIESICSILGERFIKKEEPKDFQDLKEEVETVKPRLEEMRRRRVEREKRFAEVMDEIGKISVEIFGVGGDNPCYSVVEDRDLSVNKLEGLQRQLRELQVEKGNRQKQVEGHLGTLRSMCGVLAMDFGGTVRGIHSSLVDTKGDKDITNDTIKMLVTTIDSLRQVKMERMHRLQEFATTLLELWILLDTPTGEQQMFHDITRNIASSEREITEPNALSVDVLKCVEAEVDRLKQLKLSKVTELLFNKTLELEELCRKAHLVYEAPNAKTRQVEDMASGSVDAVHLLEEFDIEIAKVKAEAISRKELLDKVEKWMSACEEECWLGEYNRDANRYNSGRGVHLSLKRAEKARAMVNKIPAMVEALTLKIISWEDEKGVRFLYDGERLLSRLEEYNHLRKEKEKERQRQRDQKRLQVQLIAEQEAVYGSKPTPSKSGNKTSRTPLAHSSNRKLSLGGAMLQNFRAERPSSRMCPNRKGESLNENRCLAQELHCAFSSQYSVRRNSEVPGHIVTKKQSSISTKQFQTKPQLIRKPLSPVPSTLSSNANISNPLEDQIGFQAGIFESSLSCTKTPTRTPPKFVFSGDEKNRSPKALPTSMLATPATVTAPMLMALTPATPYVSSIKTSKRIGQIEYSFEELRAGFIAEA